jgi:LysR family glycine cleavage system transcriptional activator
MAERLPPLNALRAFEAAGRHRSFTRAADELFVTQAAISHQIKALEEFLGLKLFRRYNRRLELTDAGQVYLLSIREAFELIGSATRRLRPAGAQAQLKISTLPSFATRWLIRRLSRFHERHPNIELMFSTSQQLVELGPDGFDIAVRVGLGNYPGLHVVPLMEDVAFPVCSPQLVAAGLKEPGDLVHQLLLHDFSVTRDDDGPNWRQWLRQAGARGVQADKGPAYNDTGMAIQAAIAGQGVALGRRSLVVDDLKAGHLVCPFGPEVPTRFSWFFVCTPESAERPMVEAFLTWLREEIALDFGEEGEV